MPNRIFMSYRRRGESTGYAGRLADKLKRAFGEEEYFRDVDDIKPGVDFVDAIDEHMASCKVLLVIIGTDWLTLADAAGRRRLSDPRDWVRLEVGAALKRKALVLPVLVGGATMPGEEDLPDELQVLARRQAIELSDSRWDYDVEQLLNRVAETAGLERRVSVPTGPRQPPQPPRWRRIMIWGGVVLVGLIVLSLLTQETATIGPGTGDPAVLEQPDLAATIRRADAAEIQAQREVDERYLSPVYSGHQLAEERAGVQALRASNRFAVMQLESQAFESFAVNPERSRAIVQVVETWSGAFYSSATEECIERVPRHRAPQRVFLGRTALGWTIDSIEFYAAAPARVACVGDEPR